MVYRFCFLARTRVFLGFSRGLSESEPEEEDSKYLFLLFFFTFFFSLLGTDSILSWSELESVTAVRWLLNTSVVPLWYAVS